MRVEIAVSNLVPVDVNIIDRNLDNPLEITVEGFGGNHLPALSIPERHRSAIAAFGNLPNDLFSLLFEALKSSPPSDTAKDLTVHLAKMVPARSQEDLTKMVLALSSLQGVYRASHVSPSEFASDVWDALSFDSPELVETVDPAQLRSRVSAFIKEVDLKLTSVKVQELRGEVERAFCTARILTDMRAAFSGDASEPPSALTIMQTLEIRYHDDAGRHREFYVALDDDDLVTLKEAIERAEQKRETLKRALEKTEFNVFE